jgi:hypothetical protein
MQKDPTKKSFLEKQIPTLLGLGVLLVALVAGMVLLGGDTGVFAPRATPQTTPKNIKFTNVTDTGFTASFLTDDKVAGFIKYGTAADKLTSQASDDRDQLSGTVGEYQQHHITVRGLQPNTNYYFLLGTGTRSTFDNSGAPFTLKTAARGGAPSAAKTVYGSVVTDAGTPADGAIVYVALEGVGEMSSLVKSSGSWAIPLSNARLADGTGYATINPNGAMSVLVQGASPTLKSQFVVSVAAAQPVPNVTLGQVPTITDAGTGEGGSLSEGTTGNEIGAGGSASPSAGIDAAGSSNAFFANTSSPSAVTLPPLPTPSVNPGALAGLASGSATASKSATASSSGALNGAIVDTLDLSKGNTQVVTTTQPVIVGKAVPNVKVMIEVHSDTQIQQQLVTDANGNFTLDIEALKKNLEPGEHTATYSYTDPKTNQVVTKTVTFTVEPPASTGGTTKTSTTQVAQASSSPTPYGSGNPYTIGGSASSSASKSASPSPKTSTRSAVISSGSGVPVSGAVETTIALIVGGFFFILAGVWSFWVAREMESEQL